MVKLPTIGLNRLDFERDHGLIVRATRRMAVISRSAWCVVLVERAKDVPYAYWRVATTTDRRVAFALDDAHDKKLFHTYIIFQIAPLTNDRISSAPKMGHICREINIIAITRNVRSTFFATLPRRVARLFGVSLLNCSRCGKGFRRFGILHILAFLVHGAGIRSFSGRLLDECKQLFLAVGHEQFEAALSQQGRINQVRR